MQTGSTRDSVIRIVHNSEGDGDKERTCLRAAVDIAPLDNAYGHIMSRSMRVLFLVEAHGYA